MNAVSAMFAQLLILTLAAACALDSEVFGDQQGAGGSTTSAGGGGTGATGGTGGEGGTVVVAPLENHTELPGCVLWLRADIGITLEGANVSAWADQSGVGNDFSQPSPANQPAYQATTPTLNGQASIDFVVGTKVLVRNAGIAASLDDSTHYYAYYSDNSQQISGTLMRGGVGQVGGISYAGNPSGRVGYFDGTEHRSGPTGIGAKQVVGLFLESDVGAKYRRNGTGAGGVLPYDGDYDYQSEPATIGNNIAVSNDLLADLAEVIIYDRALTADETARLEAYLLTRYGL